MIATILGLIAVLWLHQSRTTLASDDGVDSLSIVRRDDGPGEVELQAECVIAGKWVLFRVTVDRDFDWMPTRIQTYDALYNVLKEDLTVTEARKVDGVWIPVKGHRTGFAVDTLAITDDVTARLRRASQDLGIGDAADVSDAEVRKRIRSAVAAVFPSGMPSHILADGTQRMVVTNIESVNKNIPDERFLLTLPAGARVFDALRDEPHEIQDDAKD